MKNVRESGSWKEVPLDSSDLEKHLLLLRKTLKMVLNIQRNDLKEVLMTDVPSTLEDAHLTCSALRDNYKQITE